MEYNYTDGNSTNSTNQTSELYPDMEVTIALYKYFIPLMLIFCLLSVIINLRVLIAMKWVRRPISPTLYISLSLAAADALASGCIGVGLLINSYLPIIFEIFTPCPMAVVLEIYRLSSVIITVFHLLALSMNHYLGILKPLHYLSIMTTKKTTVIIILMWILPIIILTTFIVFNSERAPFWEDICTNGNILEKFSFRVMFSLMFIVPLIFMIVCYTHILVIVRKQQKMWTTLSRVGSTRNRGLKTKCQQKSNLEGNVKAIHTTLLILGSCMVGWLPALTWHFLICPSGCVYSSTYIKARLDNVYVLFFISWFFNILIILKTMANPIIYSSRMLEVEEATRKLHLALRHLCSSRSDKELLQQQRYRLTYSASSQVGVTAMCKMNGSITSRSIVRTTLPKNTFV